MKSVKTVPALGILTALPISWFIANWWNMSSGDPWCLRLIPKWVDTMIQLLATPLLSPDIGTAAEQMDFIEIWISTLLMITIIIASTVAAFRKYLPKESDLAKTNEVVLRD